MRETELKEAVNGMERLQQGLREPYTAIGREKFL